MLAGKNIEVSIGGSRIVRGTTLEVPAKSVACLMGRNGVGKTTTLKAIIGLLRADSGQVSLEGREISPHLTVDENLRIGALAQGNKLNGNLDRVLELFPILKECLPRKGGILSVGQQQHLAIGRAILPTLKCSSSTAPPRESHPTSSTKSGTRFGCSGARAG